MVTACEGVSVERVALPDRMELAKSWKNLQERSDHSVFQSWAWIGLWLELLPRGLSLSLLRATCGGRIVGLGILCARSPALGSVFGSRSLHLNSTGDVRLDHLTIEYNGLLVERGNGDRVARACLEALSRQEGWDELVFDGIADDSLIRAASERALMVEVRRDRPVPFVDLGAIRREGRTYLSVLSGQARSNLKRSIKEGENLGGCRLEAAGSAEEALQWLEALAQLHQRAWNGKGKPGAFANVFFAAFHRELVRREWASGIAQVLRLSVSGQPVGYLYNLVLGGRVCQYQSGFDFGFSTGSAWRPGMMSHGLAIERYGADGFEAYDFLAGDHLYKRQMSTATGRMRWISARRPRFKFAVEDFVRRLAGRSRNPGVPGEVPAGGG